MKGKYLTLLLLLCYVIDPKFELKKDITSKRNQFSL